MIPRLLLQRFRVPRPYSHSIATVLRPTRPQISPSFISPAHLSKPTFSRWYSSEPAEKTSTENEAQSTADGKQAENPLAAELNLKNSEIIELKDKYLRSIAEYRNLLERSKRDMQSAKDFAISSFAKDLIESVDNLDRALSMVPQEKLNASEKSENLKDLIALYDGLKMTETILMSTLKKHGLERFDPSIEGEKFNPNEHEAVFMTSVNDKEDNTVFQTQQKGFKLKGRVLRAAKVGVVKNP